MWIPFAIEAAAQLKQGLDKRSADNYNAMIAAENANIAKMKGAMDANAIAQQGAFEEGQQMADYGGSGVTMRGSPMDVVADTAIKTQYRENVARFNATVAANNDSAQSQLDTWAGSQDLQAGALSAAGVMANYYAKTIGPPPPGGDGAPDPESNIGDPNAPGFGNTDIGAPADGARWG